VSLKFGIGIHNCREGKDYPSGFTKPEDILDLATMAEKSGFYSLWADDHITPDEALRKKDPVAPRFFEPFIVLAQVSAVTKKIKIGMGVLVSIWRDPVLAAKQIATMDVFSKGRILMGVGLGGSRFEFEAVNPRWKDAHRGKILNEQIEVMRLLFEQDHVNYNGQFYQVADVSFYPKPVQSPLPLYFTGSTEDNLLRAAKWGQGHFFSPKLDALRLGIEQLKPLLQNEKRDISQIDILISTSVSIARTHKEAEDRMSRARVMARKDHMVGTPAEIIEKIREFQKAGLTHYTAQRWAANSYGELKEQAQMFAEEVMPAFK